MGAIEGVKELARVCPQRHWRLINVDVPYDSMDQPFGIEVIQ